MPDDDVSRPELPNACLTGVDRGGGESAEGGTGGGETAAEGTCSSWPNDLAEEGATGGLEAGNARAA